VCSSSSAMEILSAVISEIDNSSVTRKTSNPLSDLDDTSVG
jgi:hypothetical protein